MKSVEGVADSRAYSMKANNSLQPSLPQALLRFRLPLLYSARRPLDFFTLTRIFSFLIKGTEEVIQNTPQKDVVCLDFGCRADHFVTVLILLTSLYPNLW